MYHHILSPVSKMLSVWFYILTRSNVEDRGQCESSSTGICHKKAIEEIAYHYYYHHN